MRRSFRWRAAATWWLVRRMPWWRWWPGVLGTFAAFYVLASVITADGTSPLTVAMATAADLLFLTGIAWCIVPKGTRGLATRIGPIDTPRLHLRPYRPEDVAAVLATIDDELMAARGLDEAYVARTFETGYATRFGLPNEWVVVDDAGAVVGLVSARRQPGTASTCTLTWWLGPGARRRGYGSELVPAVIAELHRAGHRRVRAGATEGNVAVERIMTKVGAMRVADMPHTQPDGTTTTAAWFVHTA